MPDVAEVVHAVAAAIVMADIVMAYIAMDYIVMALCPMWQRS